LKIKTLQALWLKLNERFFDGKLRPISIRLTRSRQLYGYYEPTTNSSQSVIRISGNLNKSSEDFYDTLLHEMIHQYLYEQQIEDEADHGPKFKEHAERVGILWDSTWGQS
jgi:hypothetical protein